jgi:spermidine/putrescine transport system substrate-binding protein
MPNAITRRALLRQMAGLGLGVPLLGMGLAACVESAASRYPHAGDLRFPRPGAPVRWKRYPENPPIDAGLPPESDGTLRLFNWDSSIAPDVLRDFEREFGAHVEVSTFYDMTQAISKLRVGAVRPDVFFPTVDTLGRLIVAGLVQPLQPAYLSHRDDIWPELQHPFYDQDSAYTVPYSVYSTGIGWRNDLVDTDIATLSNPWDAMWDTRNGGHVFLLDDYRAALALVLLRNGVTDINTEDARRIQGAALDLIDLADRVDLKWSANDYTYLAEGRAWVHQAWSGDMVTSPYYGEGTPDEVAQTLSYWFPADGRGAVDNDVMVIPRDAEHPVLAHRFIDYLLTREHALDNFAWLGYQQPLLTITDESAISTFPWLASPNLATTLVSRDQLANGLRQLELPPGADAAWQLAWIQFKSGG